MLTGRQRLDYEGARRRGEAGLRSLLNLRSRWRWWKSSLEWRNERTHLGKYEPGMAALDAVVWQL